MKAEQIVIKNNMAEQLKRCVHGTQFRCLAAIAAIGLLLAALVAGCQTKSDSQPPAFAHFQIFPAFTNTLTQADVISITFRYSTNFNTVQKIGLDGLVNLEGVGEVKAEGKTLRELQDELTALYKAQVKDDPITIRIVGPVAAVYVTGAVNHPGKVPLERPMTVIEAVAEAGGFDLYHAKLSKVSVLRLEGDVQRVYWLNLNHTLDGEDYSPFYLKPFDVVRVPAKTFNF